MKSRSKPSRGATNCLDSSIPGIPGRDFGGIHARRADNFGGDRVLQPCQISGRIDGKRLRNPTLDRVGQQCVNIIHSFSQWEFFEYVTQVGIGFDAVALGGFDQAVEVGTGAGAGW